MHALFVVAESHKGGGIMSFGSAIRDHASSIILLQGGCWMNGGQKPALVLLMTYSVVKVADGCQKVCSRGKQAMYNT